MGLSRVLDAADGGTFDLGPVNGLVHSLVNQTHEADIVTADDVNAQRYLDRGIRVIRFPDNTFNAVLEDLLELDDEQWALKPGGHRERGGGD